jgi:hypothetical protein
MGMQGSGRDVSSCRMKYFEYVYCSIVVSQTSLGFWLDITNIWHAPEVGLQILLMFGDEAQRYERLVYED